MRIRATHRRRPAILLRVAIAVGLAAAGCTAGGKGGEAGGGAPDRQPEFEQLLEGVRNEYAVPALAGGFVRGTEIVAAAVGVRRLDRAAPVAVDDRFHIGSVSKPISATVIATLVEEGNLGWDSTLEEVLPELADEGDPAYRDVTLEQLLSHRGGILPWEEDEEIAAAPPATGTPRQQRLAAAGWLLGQLPVADPGTEHVYSNAGYMIAAVMAEEASGLAWEELVRQRLAEPLGLTTLGFGWPGRIDPDQPWGHRSTDSGYVPHPPDDPYQLGPWLGPAGDLHMSITDLARFARLHLEGLQGRARLLRPETFRKLHEPFGDYALGWNVRETADHHLGGADTFVAAIWVSVPRNVAVVVATNADADAGLVSEVINRSLKLFEVPKP